MADFELLSRDNCEQVTGVTMLPAAGLKSSLHDHDNDKNGDDGKFFING